MQGLSIFQEPDLETRSYLDKSSQAQNTVADFTDKVVIVDDDKDDVATLTHFLKKMNESQNLASYLRCEKFLEDMEQNQKKWDQDTQMGIPRMIILDMHMPKHDGIDVLKKIKSNLEWQNVPVILVTATTSDTKINEAYELGANAFISKPFSMMDLVRAIHSGFNTSPDLS